MLSVVVFLLINKYKCNTLPRFSNISGNADTVSDIRFDLSNIMVTNVDLLCLYTEQLHMVHMCIMR